MRRTKAKNGSRQWLSHTYRHVSEFVAGCFRIAMEIELDQFGTALYWHCHYGASHR